MSAVIRPAAAADISRVHAIRMAVNENVLSDPAKVTPEEIEWYRSEAIFLVAEQACDVVGFTCANHQTGLIWALFLDRSHEGRGLGQALLDAALDRLAACGHRQAFLNTGGGTRAERFYRRHGWRETGRDLDGQIVFVKALG